jgi:hypothetical protein
MDLSYDDHVKDALYDVNDEEHLRFITDLFRTKEVCLAAVKFESTHTLALTDFGAVPMGNLDYVMENMRNIKKDDDLYLKQMEKYYLKRKELEKQSGYYGKFTNLQDKLDHYKAKNYDDMMRIMFAIVYNK